MKKIIFLLLGLSIAGCFEHKPTIVTGLEGKPLPSFSFLLMDSTSRLNTNSITNGKPTVILIFNPYCPYCRAQTEAIIDDIKSFGNIRFYMLSAFPFGLVKDYYDQYQLKNYPNITVGQDYTDFLGSYYKAAGVPYTAVYDKAQRLQQVFMGNVSTRVIRDIANK